MVPVSHHNLQSKVELQILEQAEMDKYKNLKNDRYARRTRAEYYQANVTSFAEYYQANVASITERHIKYYQANRNAVLARMGARVRCECGCTSSHGNIATHRKSQKHLKWAADNDYEVFKLAALF